MKFSKQRNANLMLMLSAFIWGTAFVAQSVGMNYIRPFTFNSIRSFIGALVLIPFIIYRKKKISSPTPQNTRALIWGGICCGIALWTGSTLQQMGIQYTTVGKAGFITALYIIIVPLLGIFLRKKISLLIWISVSLAAVGMYLLCIKEQFSINKGDLYILACSFAFSIHILLIDHFSPLVDGIQLSCIQFLFSGIFSFFPMILVDQPTSAALHAAWFPLFYAGVFSSGVAYTIQVIAQKNTDPTVSSLILSMESVFSLLAGWIILRQTMSAKELLGCVLVFFGIILAQIPAKSFTQIKRLFENIGIRIRQNM